MTPIPINEAWIRIGIDYKEVFSRISSFPKSERGNAALIEFEKAKKLVLAIRIRTHPDKNPGSLEAENEFKGASEALQAIEIHTKNFIESLNNFLIEEENKIEKRRKNSITIKID